MLSKMKIRNILLILSLIILLGSCATPKVAYFEGIEPGSQLEVLNESEIQVKPQDKISILVNTKDPMLADLFNLKKPQSQSTSSSKQELGYTVDSKGCIDFPVLGTIHIAGKTREEIASFIKTELTTKNLIKDPVVIVEFLNLSISVLGEVNHPGRFEIDKDQITLLDAISMAGDLSIYGKRENVMVQRKENGKATLYTVNLNSGQDLYSSPIYYLQQNDIVYVEPNNMRARQATVNGNNVRAASFWMSLTSLLTTIAVLIFK